MTQDITVDPLTVSIIDQRLSGIAEEIAISVNRAAHSYPTANLRDLGASMFDHQGRLVTQAEFGMALHVAGSHISLKGILDHIGRDNIYPDDFIIGNDPYIVRAGHLPDWSLVRPVFFKDELMFYLYFKTHQFDSGGSYPSCYYPRAFDIHGEGVIIPPMKVIERGVENKTAYQVILSNVRGGSIVRMDNLLVQAAMIKAEKKILEICGEYGKDVVRAAIDTSIKLTEQAIRREISTWPAGTYRAERAGDCDGTTRDPVWIKLDLTVKPDVGELIFDYSDNPPQVDFINVPLALVWAFSIIPLRWTLPAGKYLNQAVANCLTVKTKKGTVLDPVYPASCGASSPSLGGQIIECAQLALSQVVPQKAPSCWSRHCSPILAGKHPTLIDPRTGSRRWYWGSPFTSDGSSGAIWGHDGWDSQDDPQTAGGAMRASIEQNEADVPWRWLRCEWLTDSAGNGQWRGGMGTHAEYLTVHPAEEFRPGDIYVITGNSNGEAFPVFGIAGAPDGVKSKMWLKRKGKSRILHTMDIVPGEPGDIVITQSQGGGGAGDPLDRDVEQVRMDTLDEIISPKTARQVYGVVMDPETFEVDYDATNELRAKKRRKVKPSRNR